MAQGMVDVRGVTQMAFKKGLAAQMWGAWS